MIERLETTKIIRRSEWVGLNEDMPYRPPKCKFTSEDWEKLYNSEVYNDLLSMGWENKSTDFQIKMGNLLFVHENYFLGLGFRINRNGRIEEVELKSSNQKNIIPAVDDNYGKECATIGDYMRKIDLIIKMTLHKMKVVKSEEIFSQINYKNLIRKKLEEDPTNVTRKRLIIVPASMADELRSR
jgi:hypothetical protein